MASFGVYQTADTDGDQFVLEDNKSSVADGGPRNTLRLVPGSFVGEHLDAIVRFHRNEVDKQTYHEQYFIVVDMKDWRHEGVLLVNVDFDGVVDSFRQRFSYPGGVLNAIDVAATSWKEMKEHALDWPGQSMIESSASAIEEPVEADATSGLEVTK